MNYYSFTDVLIKFALIFFWMLLFCVVVSLTHIIISWFIDFFYNF